MTLEPSVGSDDPASVAVALDVGGTSIKCALVDRSGRVRHAERHPTGRGRGPDQVVATVLDVAAGLVAAATSARMEPVAAGVVVPGVVDEAAGVAEWSANLGFRRVPLRDLVAKRLNLPTVLGHDVRAGALAEARLGAGRSVRRLVFVAIGTGIAGGYVVDGQVDAGAHGAAGEIGHVVVRTGPEAPVCGCGGRGCLEAIASASAIARAYADLTGGDPPGAAAIAAGVRTREPAAVAVWDAAVAALADGLLTTIALHDPEMIVIGGGLAEAGAMLLDPLREAVAVRRTFHRLPALVRAELGDEAGCLGAALLALDPPRAP